MRNDVRTERGPAEMRAVVELRRQAGVDGPDAPYVDEESPRGDGSVLIDGIVDVGALVSSVGINWRPIATMPEDRKDGRDVLIWDQSRGEHDIAAWSENCWLDDGLRPGWHIRHTDPEWWIRPRDVTHWADINPPE